MTIMKTVSPGVRYRVLAMTVALAFLTYMDRVCISVTAPAILRDLRLTTIQMGFVFSAFTAAYALFEIPTGWWADRIGSRRVLTRIVIWWSVFTGLTGAAWDFRSLLALRALFGAGEAGAWPTVARALSRWFPERERGTAQGIFFMGAHLGGGLTPILVAAIAERLGWRATFPLLSVFGFVWAASWFRWYRDEPRDHASVSAEEVAWIESGKRAMPEELSNSRHSPSGLENAGSLVPVRDVFHPDVWLQFIRDLDANLSAARKATAWSGAGHSRRPASAAERSRGFVGRYPYRPAQPETRITPGPLPGWIRLFSGGRSISLLRRTGGRKDRRRTDCVGCRLVEFSTRSKLGRLRGYGG